MAAAPLDKPARRSSMDADAFNSNYKFVKTLGEGSFGKVKLAQHVTTGEKVAVKILEKSRLAKVDDMTRAQREIKVLTLVRHPNIAQLFEVVDNEKQIHLVLEHAPGGELFDYIVQHKRVKEKEARVFFRQILSAVEFCHKNFIIHRDLKPENLLLDSNCNIKIIDFGFSNSFQDGELLKTFCGSPAYAAPEMVLGEEYVGPKVDIWSMGVILFALTCGFLPFDDPNVTKLYNKIVKGVYKPPFFLSESVKDLIARMLVIKPAERATLDEIKNHAWVLEDFGYPPESMIPKRDPISSVEEGLLDELVAMGFDREDTRKKCLGNDHCLAVCAYYLLHEKKYKTAPAPSAADEAAKRLEEQGRATLAVKGGTPKRRVSLGGSTLDSINEDGGTTSPPAGAATPVAAAPAPAPAVAPQPKKTRRHSIAIPSNDQAATLTNPAPVVEGKGKEAAAPVPAPDSPAGGAPPAAAGAPEEAPEEGGGRKRRFSLDAAMSSIAAAFGKKKGSKEPEKKLRTVKGPFSVATTSNKTPDEIVAEVRRVVLANEIDIVLKGYVFDCQCTVNGAGLRFEIEVCKLERLSLNGLRLKRVSGDTWAYKRQCLLLLSQMKL